MQFFLYAEIDLFCIVILGIILMKSSNGMDKRLEDIRLELAIISAIASNILDLLWVALEMDIVSFPAPVVWSIDFLYFIATGCITFFWFLYSETIQGNAQLKNKHVMAFCAAPLAILFVLLICSRNTGWVFYVDAAGVYHRGKLYFVELLLPYGYIIFTACKAFVKAMKKQNYAIRGKLLSVARFGILPTICGILQIALHGVPMLPVGIAVSFLLVYLEYQQRLISLDPLTGICNRRKILLLLSSEMKSISPDEHLYLLIIDIDWFKKINDQYGHNEGDLVLMAVAKALKQVSAQEGGFCGRYGGDEFVVIQRLKDGENVDLFCEKIRMAIARGCKQAGFHYEVRISIGCSEYTNDIESIPELIAFADKNMYREKEARPEATGA